MSPPNTEDLVDMTEEFDEALETPPRPALGRPPNSHLKATSPEYVPGTWWNNEKGGFDSPATATSTAAPSLPSYDGMQYSEYGTEYGSPAYGSDEHFGYEAADFYDGSMMGPSLIDPSHLDLSFNPYDLKPSIPSMDFTTTAQYSETPWGAYDDGLAVSNNATYSSGSEYYGWEASMPQATTASWVSESSGTVAAKNAEAIDLACQAISAALNVKQSPAAEMPAAPPGKHLDVPGNRQATQNTSADSPRTALLKLSGAYKALDSLQKSKQQEMAARNRASRELMRVVGARAQMNSSAGKSPIYGRYELLQLRALGRCSKLTAPGFGARKLEAS